MREHPDHHDAELLLRLYDLRREAKMRQGREWFQMEFQAKTLEEFWLRHPVDPEVREFADTLIRGTKLHEAKIDEFITRYAQNWELDRMAVVDRNILREGIFELLWAQDVPPKVAINEALEVAKKFSTQESSRFINGILDRIHKELGPAP